MDAQTHQALSLLQQAFDALEATADSDIDTFEDEEEEAQAMTRPLQRLLTVRARWPVMPNAKLKVGPT